MPGPRCTVCDHPERTAIDVALSTASERSISKRWNISSAAVHRHKVNHVARAVARIAEKRENLGAAGLLDRVQSLLEAAEDGIDKAKAKGDLKALAGLIREARETAVRLGQIQGLWAERGITAVNVERMQVNVAALSTEELRNLARLASNETPALEGDVC